MCQGDWGVCWIQMVPCGRISMARAQFLQRRPHYRSCRAAFIILLCLAWIVSAGDVAAEVSTRNFVGDKKYLDVPLDRRKCAASDAIGLRQLQTLSEQKIRDQFAIPSSETRGNLGRSSTQNNEEEAEVRCPYSGRPTQQIESNKCPVANFLRNQVNSCSSSEAPVVDLRQTHSEVVPCCEGSQCLLHDLIEEASMTCRIVAPKSKPLREKSGQKWPLPLHRILLKLKGALKHMDEPCRNDQTCIGRDAAGPVLSKLHRFTTTIDYLWATFKDAPQDSLADGDELCWLFSDEGFCPVLDLKAPYSMEAVQSSLKSVRQDIESRSHCLVTRHTPPSMCTPHPWFLPVPESSTQLSRKSAPVYKEEDWVMYLTLLRTRFQRWLSVLKKTGGKALSPHRTRTARKVVEGSEERADLSGEEQSMNLKVNFASNDLGARVVRASDGSVGAGNMLRGDADRYMLSPCRDKLRFVVIELSQEIVVEVVDIMNSEYYSSSPKQVMLLGSGHYPTDQWQHLGVFDFADSLEKQTLRLSRPAIARYLKVVFIGSQGSEFYCTITEIRAFGKTLIDDWKQDMESHDAIVATEDISKKPHLRDMLLRGGDLGSMKSFPPVLNPSISGYENVFRRVTRSIRWLHLNQSQLEARVDAHVQRLETELKAVRKEASTARFEAITLREVILSSNAQLLKEIESARRFAGWSLAIAGMCAMCLLLVVGFHARNLIGLAVAFISKAIDAGFPDQPLVSGDLRSKQKRKPKRNRARPATKTKESLGDLERLVTRAKTAPEPVDGPPPKHNAQNGIGRALTLERSIDFNKELPPRPRRVSFPTMKSACDVASAHNRYHLLTSQSQSVKPWT